MALTAIGEVPQWRRGSWLKQLPNTYFAIFYRKFRVYPFFSVFLVFFFFFSLFRNSLFRLFRFCTETESFDVSIEPKQTEDPPNSLKESIFWVFFRKFMVVSVCFGVLRNSAVCFGCFDAGSKHRNKLKYFGFGFTKKIEANAKQILFRFVSVQTEIYFVCFEDNLVFMHR